MLPDAPVAAHVGRSEHTPLPLYIHPPCSGGLLLLRSPVLLPLRQSSGPRHSIACLVAKRLRASAPSARCSVIVLETKKKRGKPACRSCCKFLLSMQSLYLTGGARCGSRPRPAGRRAMSFILGVLPQWLVLLQVCIRWPLARPSAARA